MTSLHDNDNTLLALVRTTFDAHSAVLFLPDNNGTCSVALSSSDEPPFVQEVSIAPGRGLVGWILRQRQPVIVNDLDIRHTFLGYYPADEESAVTAFMGCYMPDGGALCVDSIRQRTFTEADQLLLHRFARHIAKQVHSAGLASNAAELQRYFDKLEMLFESEQIPAWSDYLKAFLQIVSEGSGFEYVMFASTTEGAETYTVECENAPLFAGDSGSGIALANGGLISWVFRNDGPVYISGEDGPGTPLFGKLEELPEFQSVICLPVLLNRVTCGVLCLASTEPHALPPYLRTFTRMAANLLSQYINRLSLRMKVKSLLPRAKVHRDGAMAYDPDTAPSAPLAEEE